jgi:hypothetical protein
MPAQGSLIVAHFGIKSSPHRPFCRCKPQVAYTTATVAMRKSLFAQGVIAPTAIAPMVVLKKPAAHHWSVQLKSTSKAGPVVSIMPRVNNAFANEKSKK